MADVFVRSATRVALVVLGALGASALAGCERGCLARRLEGAEPEAPRSGSPSAGGTGPRGSRGPDLGGTDCSPGLARCVGGLVELSVEAHLPSTCTPTEKSGSCACPWSPGPRCERGCVADGLEVLATTVEAAGEQLCRPDPAAPVVRPLLPTEVALATICAAEAVTCEDGIIRTCAAVGQPARFVAACAHGCAQGVGLAPEDFLTGDGPAPILCRRNHAERR